MTKRPKQGVYEIEITDWHFDFAFGLMPTSLSRDPYLDLRKIHVSGLLMRAPRKTLTFYGLEVSPDERLDDVEARSRHKPKAVGIVQVRKGEMYANLSCPVLAISPLVQAFAAGKLRYARMVAEDWHLKDAQVIHYSFEKDMVEYG